MHDTLLSPPAEPPTCFDEYRWDQWLRAVRFQLLEEERPENYCTDCLPEYQKRMVDEGLCGHPETRFYLCRDVDGSECVVGYREPSAGFRATHREVFVE